MNTTDEAASHFNEVTRVRSTPQTTVTVEPSDDAPRRPWADGDDSSESRAPCHRPPEGGTRRGQRAPAALLRPRRRHDHGAGPPGEIVWSRVSPTGAARRHRRGRCRGRRDRAPWQATTPQWPIMPPSQSKIWPATVKNRSPTPTTQPRPVNRDEGGDVRRDGHRGPPLRGHARLGRPRRPVGRLPSGTTATQ